jgi:ABC-type bacteriocin/lantibiotic exporter with double-glycine peptidase domain
LIVVGLCGTVNQFLFEVAGQKIEAKLKVRLYNSIIDQEMGFFDNSNTGNTLKTNNKNRNISCLLLYL